MSHESPISISLIRDVDVLSAQHTLRNLANEVGFVANETEELVLVVFELASNLLKHASGGRLVFKILNRDDKRGLEIESFDDGPGIPDPELALKDGYSTAGSLGYGLGTVNRLTDEMELASTVGIGSRVICRRWVRPKIQSFAAARLEFGVVTRAFRNSEENGDAFVVKRWNKQALGAVIDGLGHGPEAARASSAARGYIEAHFDQPLDNLLRGTDRACRATRGAVIALAAVGESSSLIFSGIGNIEARIVERGKTTRTRSIRGIIGGGMPIPQVMQHSWGPNHVLVMHSDGVRSDWQWNEFPGLGEDEAPIIARRLFRTLAKADDDATILVMKSAAL